MPHQDFFKDCRPQSSRREVMHLQMYRGDTLEFKAFIVDGEDAVDVTGGYFWFTVKRDINDPDTSAVIRKELGSGIQILNGPLGYLLVTVDPIDTIMLNEEEAVTYYWDLQYQDALGVVQTVFIGRLTVLQDVTRFRSFSIGSVGIIAVAVVTAGNFVAGVNAVQDGFALQNEVQSVHATGVVSGTFTLTVEDPNNIGTFETTTAMPWNVSAAVLKSTLETDITFIDTVSVSGAASLDLGAIDVTFDGPLVANLNVSLMTMDVSLLL